MGEIVKIPKQRNYAIDFVRAICLLSIILAHVDAPELIQNIRCFDVVCLVFLSGMSYEISASRKQEKYIQYMGKRIKKLLVPTYIILTLIFSSVFIVNHSPEPIGLIKMVESYLLYNGIGYVWFVRVTLLLAAISPLLLAVQRKWALKKQIVLFTVWVVTYIGVVAFYNANILPFWPNLFVYNVPVFLLGYGIPYAFGMQYHKLRPRTKWIIVSVFALCGIVAVLCGVKNASGDKYPPGMLYLAWGGIWAVALYELFSSQNLKRIPKCILFLSVNSFDIYLFHIIPLLILKYVKNSAINVINTSWVLQYVFVLGMALIIAEISSLVRKYLIEQRREGIS